MGTTTIEMFTAIIIITTATATIAIILLSDSMLHF